MSGKSTEILENRQTNQVNMEFRKVLRYALTVPFLPLLAVFWFITNVGDLFLWLYNGDK